MLIASELAVVLLLHAGWATAYLALLAVPSWIASRRWGRLAWAPWRALLVAMAIFATAITVFEMAGFVYRHDPPAYPFWADWATRIPRQREDDWLGPWSWPRIVFPVLYAGTAALAGALAVRWARPTGTTNAIALGLLAVALFSPYLYVSFLAALFFNACFFGDSLVAGVSPNC